MITYFAGQFLEGAGQLRWLRHWRAVRARVIRNRETVRALARTCGFTYSNCRGRPRAACLCAPRIAALKTRLENDPAVRNARYSCGPDRCILWHPFVHLPAGWAMHRNGHARKAFEQNPLGLKTGCNECARARALNEYIGQRRTPSGDAINVWFSRRAPALRTRQDGSARTRAWRPRLPCEIC